MTRLLQMNFSVLLPLVESQLGIITTSLRSFRIYHLAVSYAPGDQATKHLKMMLLWFHK